MSRIEYSGAAYVRPCGRGIVLEDIDTYLEDFLPEGNIHLTIIVSDGKVESEEGTDY